MKVKISSKEFDCVNVFCNELAFSIDDAVKVLDCYNELSIIILGGDILNNQLKHNYDNWYYNISNNLSNDQNIKQSIDVARKYLLNYIKKNGSDYYCVFVLQKPKPVRCQSVDGCREA